MDSEDDDPGSDPATPVHEEEPDSPPPPSSRGHAMDPYTPHQEVADEEPAPLDLLNQFHLCGNPDESWYQPFRGMDFSFDPPALHLPRVNWSNLHPPKQISFMVHMGDDQSLQCGDHKVVCPLFMDNGAIMIQDLKSPRPEKAHRPILIIETNM